MKRAIRQRGRLVSNGVRVNLRVPSKRLYQKTPSHRFDGLCSENQFIDRGPALLCLTVFLRNTPGALVCETKLIVDLSTRVFFAHSLSLCLIPPRPRERARKRGPPARHHTALLFRVSPLLRSHRGSFDHRSPTVSKNNTRVQPMDFEKEKISSEPREESPHQRCCTEFSPSAETRWFCKS